MASMEKALPKPKVSDFVEESDEEEEEDEGEEEGNSHGEISDRSDCG
jgi:hypothetical protein